MILSKKLLIILGVCVALIALAVMGYFTKYDSKISENKTFGKTSLSIAHVENPENNFQYFQFVLPDPQKNVVQCEKYADYELNTRCYQSLALLRKDALFCENIRGSFETGWMYKSDCYDAVAIATQDATLCKNDGCVTTINKDVSKCPPLGDSYNGSIQCYTDIAVAKKDLSVCDFFGNDETSKFACYEDVARVKEDVSVCELVSAKDDKRDHCYSTVLADTKNQDISLCDKIHVNHWNKYCKLRVAFQNAARDNDIKICSSLSDQDSKDNCFWEVANGQNNPLLCELMKKDDLWLNQCIIQSSPAMHDSGACNNLKGANYDTPNKDLCYFQYATTNQKPEICQKMSKSDFKDKCLKGITD